MQGTVSETQPLSPGDLDSTSTIYIVWFLGELQNVWASVFSAIKWENNFDFTVAKRNK